MMSQSKDEKKKMKEEKRSKALKGYMDIRNNTEGLPPASVDQAITELVALGVVVVGVIVLGVVLVTKFF